MTVRRIVSAGAAALAACGALGIAPAAAQASSPKAGTISTVAGGVGGPGTATSVPMTPCNVTSGGGHLYIADNENKIRTGLAGAIREMSPSSSRLTTPYGSYVSGPSGNGAKASTATVVTCNMTVDSYGNLVISAWPTNQVRVIAKSSGTYYGKSMTAGHIYTVAGNGKKGFAGDGGPATSAELDGPSGLTVDAAGNLVLADEGNQRIRVVAKSTGKFYGKSMTAGDIYTVAGDGSAGFAGDSGPATSAELNFPGSVAVDGAGNLVIADLDNCRVRVVADSNGTFYGQAMTAEHIYTVAGNGQCGYSGDGALATNADLTVGDVAVDGAGNVVIDAGNRIRVVATTTGTFYGESMTAGNIYTVAGDGVTGDSGNGGPATSADLNAYGMTLDAAGNLVIADYGDRVVRVVAHSTGSFYGKSMTAGNIYAVAGTGQPYGFSGNRGPATQAETASPAAVAAGPAGSTLLSDNYRVQVVAKTTGTLFGMAVKAGNIYTVAGTGQQGDSGDGGPATSAKMDPGYVAKDAAGNLVISDPAHCRIRVVADASGTFYGVAMKAGYIYPVAGDGNCTFSGPGGPATSAGIAPAGVTADAAGNLVIAANDRILVVAKSSGTFYGQSMTAGNIYTVAGDGSAEYSGDGGPAIDAGMEPLGVAVDGAGNLVIGDFGNYRVRVVAEKTGAFYGQSMKAGDIYTVAGNGSDHYSGDGGPAVDAGIRFPGELTVDAAGNVIIADTYDNRVRVVAPSAGTFYGIAMKAGNIYTVAGDGKTGFSGDGGPGTKAAVAEPTSVAVNSAGNLLIAAAADNRVQMVTG
jgi:ribulose-5-phosphate 4-epimerase/fuculose-1-phosphate aldolase